MGAVRNIRFLRESRKDSLNQARKFGELTHSREFAGLAKTPVHNRVTAT